MIQELSKKANLYIWSGILFELIYWGAKELQFNNLPIIFLLAGIILIVTGCTYYSKSKGYSGSLGFFLGLLGVIGLLFLFLSPDKTKAPKT